jgi:ubiquinone/menaquinone biosynthesis C-methylase UbiE
MLYLRRPDEPVQKQENMRMADSSQVCSWRRAPALDNPIRRLIHNPRRILVGLVEKGQTVLDIGCGPGTFSIAMAEMVGGTGKVISVDVQEEMLEILRKKAARKGLESRIITYRSDPDRIGITAEVDFALAFYMVHEAPDAQALLSEIASMLKPQGKLLIVEPNFHVSAFAFKNTLEAAKRAGFEPIGEPKILFSRSILLRRG